MSNLPHVQDGLAVSATGTVRLSAYLEGRIAHHHHMIDVYMSKYASLPKAALRSDHLPQTFHCAANRPQAKP